ncbi:Mediator of RNA polymerase II transcription subunit 7 [Colletotrichum chlorophyti]|uniref:Mediator of RNA polymerase II transcription subunit 7 n=1 Tax=Colletotrichum chlorophyti TaxID=708187 RepID=A0A1Q8RS33_9PEZI|nr:Mediator of RNA polymerase II transcription subunit 7 [Colletotrichum chlorophyti]
MADNPDEPSQSALASTFPNPPPFWRDFTTNNLTRIEDLRKAQAEKDGVAVKDLPVRIPDIPADLINLQSPAEPATGTWKVLGGQYTLDDKLPSLEEGEIKRLVPAHSEEKDGKHLDRAFELKKMAKSLLLNFLELISIMATVPDDAAAKVEDLRTLFINFHHLLNEYRPHQARESAIALMQTKLDRTRAETAAIRAQVDKAKRVLEGLGSIEPPKVPDAIGSAVDGELTSKEAEAFGKVREQEVWQEADALFL